MLSLSLYCQSEVTSMALWRRSIGVDIDNFKSRLFQNHFKGLFGALKSLTNVPQHHIEVVAGTEGFDENIGISKF